MRVGEPSAVGIGHAHADEELPDPGRDRSAGDAAVEAEHFGDLIATRMSGLRALIGSWKTIETRSERIRASRFSFAVSTLPAKPATVTVPLACSSSGRRPMIEAAVSDLPDPDSPMSPTRSPARMERDTESRTGVGDRPG